MKLAYVVFARNKEEHVPACVNSILAQTHSPMDIYFSDQGSEDNTLAAIKKTVNGYNGPNKVRVLECPDTESRGQAGLMAHINWLHNNIDADFWITSAADDIDYPDRAKRTVETLETLDRKPLFFGVGQDFANPDLTSNSHNAKPDHSKWVEPIETLRDLIGGSVPGAWDPQLMNDFGPLPPQALSDVYLPFCAALMDRFYYLHEIHHAYVWRDDPNNTGLGGLMAQTDEGSDERLQLQEMVQYELAANMCVMTSVAQAIAESHPSPGMEDTLQYLYSGCLAQLGGWCAKRAELTAKRVPPQAVPA